MFGAPPPPHTGYRGGQFKSLMHPDVELLLLLLMLFISCCCCFHYPCGCPCCCIFVVFAIDLVVVVVVVIDIGIFTSSAVVTIVTKRAIGVVKRVTDRIKIRAVGVVGTT